jgi:TetR/AcrR family transcriptional regulator, transcriptional repressor for nem operon
MRVDRQTLAAHHSALLAAAGRLFRGRGLAAVSVADISGAAGLTHGAFYGHYPSKEALAAEACRATLDESAARWRRRADRARENGQSPLGTLIADYLSEHHRDQPESGCTLSAIGAEAARAGAPVAQALAQGVGSLTAVLEAELAAHDPTLDDAACRSRALAVLAVLSGGLLVARSCRADPNTAKAALASAIALARQAAGLAGS